MQITLVAHYGPKSTELRANLTRLQNLLKQAYKTGFEAYEIEQVHASVIGLEGIKQGDQILNANYQLRGERRYMDLSGMLDFLEQTPDLPCQIQVGGFDSEALYPFTSRGQHPYQRSFGIQGSIAVAMGWPCSGSTYPRSLDSLRRGFNAYHAMHKYHLQDGSIDNDFFFVLGRLQPQLMPSEPVEKLEEIEEKLRKDLAKHPFILNLDLGDLSFVFYDDAQLPWGHCLQIPFSDAKRNLDKFISKLVSGDSAVEVVDNR